jgi:hypothetical protein
MIHHLSIAAENPERAARVIAALWRGEAFPFPPVAKGSWVAMAGDDRNTTIEVYPLGAELYPVDGDADSEARMSAEPRAHTPTHAAIASPLSEKEVYALAAEHGWVAKYRKRGGIFGVIEFWIEDSVLLEVLTDEMQQEYVTRATPAGFRAMLAAGGPPKAAA